MFTAQLWRLFWKIVDRLPWRIYWLIYSRLRCEGSQPALSWVNDPSFQQGGYYRSGIMRQYCVRSRWHDGDCIAPYSHLGEREMSSFFSNKKWQN